MLILKNKKLEQLLRQQLGQRILRRISDYQCCPLEQPKSMRLQILQDKGIKYKMSELQSGVKVLTESQQFPSMVNIGVLIGTGTREESIEQSGSLLSIKQNFLKTKDSMDGLKNLEYLYKSGGYLDMDYDQENSYFKAQFLEENLDEMLDLIIKCSLQQKTENIDFELVEQSRKEEEQQYSLQEIMFKQAYGNGEWQQGLGMPLLGIRDNNVSQHLNRDQLHSFYQNKYTLDRIYIAASGVRDHNEFCKILQEKINKFSDLSLKSTPTQLTYYHGGRIMMNTSNADNQQYKHLDQETLEKLNEDLECALVFQSYGWSDDQLVPLNVAYTLLGNSSSFSSGGPGKGMHARTTKNMLNSTNYINSAACINSLFTDSGLFGLEAAGSYQDANKLVVKIAKELINLQSHIDPVELSRAKNILKSNVNMVLQRQQDRLEETIKNIRLIGEIGHDKYNEQIDKVKSEDINQIMKKIMKGKLTYASRGKHIDNIIDYKQIQEMFQQ